MVIELMRELGKNQTDIYLGILENNTDSHRIIAEKAKRFINNVITFPCIHKFDLKSLFLMRKFIEDNKIDLIHSHKYKTNFYSYLATLPKKTPIVSTCHNWISESCKMKIYEWIDKKILSKFDRVVAVSDEVKNKILDSGIPEYKVLKISNGIAVEDYSGNNERDNIRTDFGIDKDSIVIGNVGRLDDNKGIDNLLKVIKSLTEKHEDILLLIVGDGPSTQKLQENAKVLGIKEKVVFAGFRKDIASILSAIDIFVLPSLIEGLPMVLLEAMASRKPVIATRVGDIPQIIKHKESGLLVQPRDTVQLQDAIEYLIQNRDESSLMAKRGYEKVQHEHSSNQMARQYMEIYCDVFQSRANAAKLMEAS